MKIKRKIAGLIIAALVIVPLTNTRIAFARTTYAMSPTITQSVYGYSYIFYSTIGVDPTKGACGSTGWGSLERVAPTGYVGAQAILYKGSTLCKYGDWNYNNVESGGTGLSTDYNKETGIYYSCGKVQFYNGNGYNEYTANQSPRLSFTLNNISSLNKTNNVVSELNNLTIPTTKTNENGETYGSGLAVYTTGEEPDLIAAYGIEGTLGYVRTTELESKKASTPEEAIAITKQNCNGRTVNLYDNTGENVIGSFKISPSQITTITK